MPPVPKKIPMRQCVGCREHRPKRELVRIVRSPEGVVSLDFSGKANGRGAYLCRRPECLRKAVRARALERAFSAFSLAMQSGYESFSTPYTPKRPAI